MRVILLASVSASVAVALAGCDLFGIRCNVDDDCPTDLPFCASGVCATEDGGRRPGDEGEGEGASDACTVDADCQASGALCYDLPDTAAHFDAARVDTCVPAANEDTSCAEAALFSSSGREVIFGARVQRVAGDCTPGEDNLSIEVNYLDRDGFGPQTSGVIFTAPPGSSSLNFVSAEVSGDGTSGILFGIDRGCYSAAVTSVTIAIGQSSPSSHGLCLPILAASAAP